MKKITFLAVLIFFQFNLFSSDALPHPEKIYSITRVSKSFEYYQEQAKLWQKEIPQKKSDPEAWYNYFLAARYANMLSGGSNPFDLKEIVDQLPEAIPNTSELFYIQYIYNGRGPEYFDLLLKAHELDPNNASILHDMVTLRESRGERDKVRQLMERWYQSGEMPSGLLKWNYNMLMSVEQNAMLITWGDNDTYPAWILQHAKNVRPDIVVVNAWMLAGYEDYRKMIFEKYDIPEMDQTKEDFKDEETYFEVLTYYILKNSKLPIYTSPSLPRIIKGNHHENLYFTGLAFKYSKEDFDNVAVMKNNFEHKFLKDYLLIDLENSLSEAVVNKANVNYIPPFLRLYRHYKESGELAKAEQLKQLIINIAEKGGKADQVLAYLGEVKNSGKAIETIIDIKTLDRDFVKIRDNLYASETELTNGEYEQFLMDLLKNKEFEKLEIAKTHKTNWRGLLPEEFQKLSDQVLFNHGHPEAPKAPIQNISHEAAQLYCKWMTQVYNSNFHKKKLYKKVLFRLPTEQEWIIAAKGGHHAIFPWGGYYVTNAKGCYLANHDVADREPCKDCKVQLLSNDGGFFTVNADAYFPNDYGCYNMSGNVAEMIQTPGIAMGGSWGDKPEDSKIDSQQKFEKPSPKVGFRVFMEVLEYKEK